MKKITIIEIALVLFLFAIALLPPVIVILTGSHAPYYPVSSRLVDEALALQGISIVSVTDNAWNLPGATGGKTYLIIDRDGQKTRISTQTFSSEEARAAAIRSWHAGGTGKGRQAGALFVKGETLIAVTPSDRPVVEILGRYLQEK